MVEGSESRVQGSRSVAAYGVILLGLLFLLSTIRPGHRAGDFSMLLQHAVNMVDGAPYAESSYLQNPDAISVGTTSYPPGVPILIAPLYALFGYNLVPMKVLMVLMFAAALVVFGLVTKRLLPWPVFMLMLFDLSFTPYFWEFKDNVESDFPFLLPLFVVLLLIARTGGSLESRSASIRHGAVLGILIYVAVSMRTIGLALIVSLFVFDVVGSRSLMPTRRFLMAAATLVVLMLLQSLVLPIDGGTYGQAFMERMNSPSKFVGSIVLNAKYYILAVTGRILMTNGHGTTWADVMLLLSVGPFAVGFYRRLRHDLGILEVFTVVYAGVLLLWPFRQPNYLIPLIPLLAFYLFGGIGHLVQNMSQYRQRIAFAVVFSLLAATYLQRYATLSFDRIPHDVMSGASMEFYDYVRSNLDEDDGIVTRLPREVALFTGRPATPPRHPRSGSNGVAEPYSNEEASAIVRRSGEIGFSYLAAGPKGFQYHQEVLPLWNILNDSPELFEPVWSNEEWRLFRIPDSE